MHIRNESTITTEDLLKSIRVRDCGLTKIRIGNDRDGGYVALKELCKKTGTVYSFGVGNDVGFELNWVERFPESKVNLYDPYIEDLPKNHERFAFYRFGLGLRFPPLTDVKEGSLLKMDIEWDEWAALLNFDDIELKKFSQVLVEFHFVHVEPRKGLTKYFNDFYQQIFNKINNDLIIMYYAVMRKMNNLFYISHIHANNSLPPITLDGFTFPPLLEISFVRKNLIDEVRPFTGTFPVKQLDFPNKTDRPDIKNFYPLGGIPHG